MDFSLLLFGDESKTELSQTKKNSRPTEGKKYKAEPSTGTPCRKRLGHEKNVLKGQSLRSTGGSHEGLASPSLCKWDGTVSITLTYLLFVSASF